MLLLEAVSDSVVPREDRAVFLRPDMTTPLLHTHARWHDDGLSRVFLHPVTIPHGDAELPTTQGSADG